MTDERPQLPPAGWYLDPTGAGAARYWNGIAWTPTVTRGDSTFDVPVDARHVNIPPVPGSAYSSPAPVVAPRVEQQPTYVVQQSAPTRSSGGVVVALIGGVVIIVALVLVIVLFQGDDSPSTPDVTNDPPVATPLPADPETPTEQQPDSDTSG